MKLSLTAVIAFLVMANVCMAQTRPASSTATSTSAPAKTRIVPGPDTTRITSPLRPDGTVDYLAALNADAAKGVTKDNNAAVLMLDILGPDFLTAEGRQKVYKDLDITPDLKTPVFDASMADDPKNEALCTKSWQAKDYPEVASWLKENTKALDLIVEAAKRPRWYVPLFTHDEAIGLLGAEVPNVRKYRESARALAMRANLAIAEGRTDDAWADIQTTYRLAALLNQKRFLIGQVTSIACSVHADKAACNLAVSGKLDAKSARDMLAKIPGVEAVPDAIVAVDHGERYIMLDLISLISVSPQRMMPDFIADPSIKQTGKSPSQPTAETIAVWESFLKEADWNTILRQANKHYDRIVTILKITDLDERQKALDACEADLKKMSQDVQKGPTANYSRTQWFTDYIISILTPAVARAQELSERAASQRQLTSVALALAAYKADKSMYPEKLADLSPDYLKELPKDFFAGGKDFIYKPADGGYILYGVGENRQDDGGKDKSQGGDDIVVKTEGK